MPLTSFKDVWACHRSANLKHVTKCSSMFERNPFCFAEFPVHGRPRAVYLYGICLGEQWRYFLPHRLQRTTWTYKHRVHMHTWSLVASFECLRQGSVVMSTSTFLTVMEDPRPGRRPEFGRRPCTEKVVECSERIRQRPPQARSVNQEFCGIVVSLNGVKRVRTRLLLSVPKPTLGFRGAFYCCN
jgi:hypothetical protein